MGLLLLLFYVLVYSTVLWSPWSNNRMYHLDLSTKTYIVATFSGGPCTWPWTVPCAVFLHHPLKYSFSACSFVYCKKNYTIQILVKKVKLFPQSSCTYCSLMRERTKTINKRLILQNQMEVFFLKWLMQSFGQNYLPNLEN